MYRVKRHGGNRNHEWKIVLETELEEEALVKYESIRTKMRQGIILLEKDGKIIKEDWAPRIRVWW